MKPLIPILAVAATSLAVASVQFARQASTQRERADTEMALRQKQEARLAQLERDHARLERELASVQSSASDAPPVAAVTPPPPQPPKAGVVRGAGAHEGVFTMIERSDPTGAPKPTVGFRGPGFMETAAGRNYMKSRTKMAMRRLHADAGDALGISDEKANELLDLLADQQTRMTDRYRGQDGQPPKPVDFREVQQKNNAEIAALIGQDKMDEWTAYQQSLPDRSQVNMVNQQLTEAGVQAMSDNQRTEMLAAVTEERQRLPRPTITQEMTPEEQFAQSNEWQAEYDKALLDRARSILNSEQYAAYKEFQDFQAEMRKNIPRFNGAPAPMVRFNAVAGDAVISSSATTAPMVIAAPAAGIAVPLPPPPERQ
jgi:hypothetical protein